MSAIHLHQKQYGPPKRVASKKYSPRLESIENFENRIVIDEYMETITQHLQNLEGSATPNPAMIDLQPQVKWFMRPYLVNFIIQMHSSLKLKPQTLFLCWNIIDRYCAKRIAYKQHYQLIGCTALWIAAKYEDKKSRVPSLSELKMMCSNVYEKNMFKEMEVHILGTLEWSVGSTSLETILQLCVKFTDPDGKEKLNKPLTSYRCNSQMVSAILAVGRFLCELSLYERTYMTFPVSIVGITAFTLACSMLGLDCGSKYLNSMYHQYRMRRIQKLRLAHAATAPNIGGELPSPITPRKGTSHYFDTATEEFDSDSENKDPNDKKPYGAFLSGFDGFASINQIRNVSLLMLKSMLQPSDVLIEKYTPLGVVAVLKNFIVENDLRTVDLKEVTIADNSAAVNEYAFDLSNLLLGFEPTLEFVTEQAMQYINPVYQSPATTKSYSAFNSPSNISSFSSASSQTTYDSCYEEIPIKGEPAVTPRGIRHCFPNSSPLVDRD